MQEEAMVLPSAGEQGSTLDEGGWTKRGLYGLSLSSDFDFGGRLVPASGPPDLTFTCVPSKPLRDCWEDTEPAYASSVEMSEGESAVSLYRLGGGCSVLDCVVANFYLWPDRILCHASDPEYHRYVEILFTGLVLATWLELRGVPALHASAVAVGERAAAFLAEPGSGKSSLAAALMQEGYPLLTDDVLAVGRGGGAYFGRPGYPQMRVWPEQAQRLVGHYEDLELVHPYHSKRRLPVGGEGGFGTFCGEPLELGCLYLPERREPEECAGGVRIEAVSAREGLMALIGHSFVVGIVEALGLHVERLGFFSRMMGEVPVRRVIYPSGYERLPEVRRAIVEDLATLPSSEE
jgi:hypothetical protein